MWAHKLGSQSLLTTYATNNAHKGKAIVLVAPHNLQQQQPW